MIISSYLHCYFVNLVTCELRVRDGNITSLPVTHNGAHYV